MRERTGLLEHWQDYVEAAQVLLERGDALVLVHRHLSLRSARCIRQVRDTNEAVEFLLIEGRKSDSLVGVRKVASSESTNLLLRQLDHSAHAQATIYEASEAASIQA